MKYSKRRILRQLKIRRWLKKVPQGPWYGKWVGSSPQPFHIPKDLMRRFVIIPPIEPIEFDYSQIEDKEISDHLRAVQQVIANEFRISVEMMFGNSRTYREAMEVVVNRTTYL